MDWAPWDSYYDQATDESSYYMGHEWLWSGSSEFMDWAPWDSYYDQATDESSYHTGHEWQCDFYFGYGLDVIEEDSLNKQACLHVLRLLITKADTEIVELKKELAILRSQLAWLDEDWLKLCSTALKEMIDCLEISIRGLKTKNIQEDHDFGNHLQMLREPAEKIHDILQALLRNCFQQKDNQSLDVTAKVSSSDHPVHSTDVLVEIKQLSDAASNTIASEEAKENWLNPVKPFQITSLKYFHFFNFDYFLDQVLSLDVTAKVSSSDHPVHSTDVLVEIKQSSDAASNTIASEEAKETNTTAAEKHATSMTFSKPLGKTSKYLGTAKRAGVIVETNLVKMHSDSMDSTTRKDLRITERPDDSANENLKSLSSSTEPHPKPSISDLNSLTINQLKKIARQYKMRGCYKLRKEELAKEVGLYIIEGRRQKKGASIAASSRG